MKFACTLAKAFLLIIAIAVLLVPGCIATANFTSIYDWVFSPYPISIDDANSAKGSAIISNEGIDLNGEFDSNIDGWTSEGGCNCGWGAKWNAECNTGGCLRWIPCGANPCTIKSPKFIVQEDLSFDLSVGTCGYTKIKINNEEVVHINDRGLPPQEQASTSFCSKGGCSECDANCKPKYEQNWFNLKIYTQKWRGQQIALSIENYGCLPGGCCNQWLSLDNVKTSNRPILQLFKMSLCPYAQQVDKDLARIWEELNGEFEIKPEFILSLQGDDCWNGYCSLHGKKEVLLDLVEACIYESYNYQFKKEEKYFEFVSDINKECKELDGTKNSFAECIENNPSIRKNSEKIMSCIENYDEIFSKYASTALEKNISASPTIIFDLTEKYEGNRDYSFLKQMICKELGNLAPNACNIIEEPAPIENNQTIILPTPAPSVPAEPAMPSVPAQEYCADGCKINNSGCLPIGTRITENGQSLFCSINKKLILQSIENSPCQNNYECKSNFCSNNLCIDINKQLKKQQSLLEKIWEWIINLFAWDSDLKNKEEIREANHQLWKDFSEKNWDKAASAYNNPYYDIDSKKYVDPVKVFEELNKELYENYQEDSPSARRQIAEFEEMLSKIEKSFDWENAKVLSYSEASKREGLVSEARMEKGDYLLMMEPLSADVEGQSATYRKINEKWTIVASTH
jgi:hypothetical protein